MRAWIYKTDEAGKPRRFLSHGEAAGWSLLTIGKLFGVVIVLTLLDAAFDAYRDGVTWWSAFPLVMSVVWLAAWLGIAGIVYLYVFLSGGIMDDEARRRYRNNETLRSR